MMSGERQKRRVEADRITLTLEHGAPEIVVEEDPRQSGPRRKRAGGARQEAIHAGIKEEAQIDLPRPRQHHDEGHQWPARASDLQVIEMGPVNLALLSGQGAQPQISLWRRTRTVYRDQVAEMMRVATVAALGDHRIQPAGR
ncbi:hypothetical protein QFZ98_004697 [Paraburkholderia youngii]